MHSSLSSIRKSSRQSVLCINIYNIFLELHIKVNSEWKLAILNICLQMDMNCDLLKFPSHPELFFHLQIEQSEFFAPFVHTINHSISTIIDVCHLLKEEWSSKSKFWDICDMIKSIWAIKWNWNFFFIAMMMSIEGGGIKNSYMCRCEWVIIESVLLVIMRIKFMAFKLAWIES